MRRSCGLLFLGCEKRKVPRARRRSDLARRIQKSRDLPNIAPSGRKIYIVLHLLNEIFFFYIILHLSDGNFEIC